MLLLLTGVGISIIATVSLVLVGRPCRLSAVYTALIWGPPAGPAIAAALLELRGRRRWLPALGAFLVVGIASLLVTLVIIPNTFGAIDRSRQKRAIADIRSIGQQLASGERIPPIDDPWGHPYIAQQSSDHYSVISWGECSEPDFPDGTPYPNGPTESPDCDIVFSDGTFVRYPLGIQP